MSYGSHSSCHDRLLDKLHLYSGGVTWDRAMLLMVGAVGQYS